MNIEKQTVEDGVLRIRIRLDREDYEEDIARELKKIRKQAKMPGFRPGKVPASLIRKQYGEAVKNEVISKKVDSALKDYMKEQNIRTVSMILPVEETDWESEIQKESPEFAYELAPVPEEINLPTDELKKIPFYEIEPDDKIIDDTIKAQRERHGEWKKTDAFEENAVMFFLVRPKDGDDNKNVVRSFAFYDQVKDNEKAMKILKKLAKGQTHEAMFKTVDAALGLSDKGQDVMTKLGVKPTDKVILEWEATERIEPAELNEAFYEKEFPGQGIKDEKAYREAVIRKVKDHFENEARILYESMLHRKLIETAEFPYPKDFLRKVVEKDFPEMEAEDREKFLEGDYKDHWIFSNLMNRYFVDRNVEVNEEAFKKAAREEAIRKLQMHNLLSYIQTEEQLEQITANWLQNDEEFMWRALENARINTFFRHLIGELNPERKKTDAENFRKIQEKQENKTPEEAPQEA